MLLRFFRRCWGFAVPLLMLPPAGIIAMWCGANPAKVAILIQFSTFAIMMLTLAYIVFLDSRKRWPGVGAFERFSRIVTFYLG